MTISDGAGTRKLRKGNSNNKGGSFDQEGSTMDLIDVKPLRSAGLIAIMPYGTSVDEDPTVEDSG